jgi:hypothetical protein
MFSQPMLDRDFIRTHRRIQQTAVGANDALGKTAPIMGRTSITRTAELRYGRPERLCPATALRDKLQ